MSRPSRFELVGGHAVLDLINTVSWRGETTQRIDRLSDLDELLTWSAHAGLIGTDELSDTGAATLLAHKRAAHAVADTRLLRERLHQVLTATESGQQQAIRLLWPQLTAALRYAQPEGLPLRPAIELHEPDDLVRRLALLALQFLTSEDVRLVSVCADHNCGWLFLDRSRNHTRRWCSSSDCGNRDRVRRYNTRHAQR